MAIARVRLGDQSLEEIGQVQHHIRIGVFLDYQRCRSVLDEDRQQSGLNSVGCDLQAMHGLRHLFYGHTLGQIARLIHITSAANRNVIRQQLQRNCLQNGQ